MSFSSDIKGRDTSLYPAIIIDRKYGSAAIDSIYLSTNSVTIDGDYYSPILLNFPGIKESIDIEKHKFKISNVSLSISNYKHNGVRFSETVGDRSLINETVDIFWVSPSATEARSTIDLARGNVYNIRFY